MSRKTLDSSQELRKKIPYENEYEKHKKERFI